MKVIRIFISSPGDVQEEREVAKQVIRGLRKRYAAFFATSARCPPPSFPA